MNTIKDIVKGDSITFECLLGENMTDWKIRCEIYDNKKSIKLATVNSGGSNADIEITDVIKGIFIINVQKDATEDFNNQSFIEIVVETCDDVPKQYTVYKNDIEFVTQKVKWEIPS